MEAFIIAGGEIDLVLLQKYCTEQKNKIIIAVDKGLEALYKINILPDHIVGDFDSIDSNIIHFYKRISEITIHQYVPEKDYTDTDIALNLAIRLQVSHITIFGALGKRMDHALANIHILTNALNANIPCQILDNHNRIYLINGTFTLEKAKVYGKYISLIPLTSYVKGLTLTGFQYPLQNYTLTVGKSLGISNEIIHDIATIDFKERHFNCNRE